LHHSFPIHWLSTKFGHVRRFSRSSRQSMRPPIHYSDPNTAGQSSGLCQINASRLIQRQDGRENSGYAAGPEENCSRQRRANSGTTSRYSVFAPTVDRPSYPNPTVAAQSNQATSAALARARTHQIVSANSSDPAGNQPRISANLLAA
jgi:hypothetical protein